MSLSDDDKQWVTAHFERVDTQFAAKLEQVQTQFETKLERVETALLTEFHHWASPVEMRVRSHSAALRAMGSRDRTGIREG